MKKICSVYIMVFFIFFLTTGILTGGLNCSLASGEDYRIASCRQIFTNSGSGLMRIISSRTSKMLDAIMIGDFNSVINESK